MEIRKKGFHFYMFNFCVINLHILEKKLLMDMNQSEENNCYEVIDMIKEIRFSPKKLPQWLFDKVNTK
jgi:hypothetical protein